MKENTLLLEELDAFDRKLRALLELALDIASTDPGIGVKRLVSISFEIENAVLNVLSDHATTSESIDSIVDYRISSLGRKEVINKKKEPVSVETKHRFAKSKAKLSEAKQLDLFSKEV